jgi:hypothetical protein
MSKDSSVASAFVESLGSRKKKYKPRATVRAVVVHTTGNGPLKRWRAEQNIPGKAQPTPFLTAVQRTYRQINVNGPHYVVGQEGECIQVCSEKLAAFHVGSEGGSLYEREDWLEVKYEWWAERWPGVDTPRALAGGRLWENGSCNANTIGIEVVPPRDDASGAWSPACWDTLHRLVLDITTRHGIPMEPEYVVTHSDAHPMSRTTDKGDPWDPGARQWTGWPQTWTVIPAVPVGIV